MKNILIGVFLFPTILFSQVQGKVFGIIDGKKVPIKQAKISLKQAEQIIYSDEAGFFEIVLSKKLPDTLIFSAKKYVSDTLIVTKEDRFVGLEIILFHENEIQDVIISFKRDSKGISKLKPILVESLGEAELQKAACCNISESFETNATVDVNITDAVSGAKKIQLLGLDGIYTQFSMENIPFMTGVEKSFGLNTIPGTWVESIQITKGVGSVTNGYESMSGLINLEFKKPNKMEAFFANGYLNHFGRSELNLHGGKELGKKWSVGNFVHGSFLQSNWDKNKDGFRDIPLSKTLSVFNRWQYDGRKMEARFGVNGSFDERKGGQYAQYLTSPFQSIISNKHLDVFAKTGFFFKNKKNTLGVLYQLKGHEVNGIVGNRSYFSNEKRAFVSPIFDGIINNASHKYRIGASFDAQNTRQLVGTTDLSIQSINTSLFGEYTYTGTRLSSVIGARFDAPTGFKSQFSPRVHLKYILDEYTDIRISSGKAWRLPLLVIDNAALLATSKSWMLPSDLKQEVVWNSGASIVRSGKLWKRNASVSMDFFHARFTNQLVVDRDMNSNVFVFQYQENKAFSNAFQVELSASPIKPLTIRLAYKYLQVMADYDGRLQQQVMTPNHRYLLNFAYASRNKKWEADATLSVFGKMRLHNVHLPSGIHETNVFSKVYPYVLGQVTRHLHAFDIYLGVENATNFTMENPIIDAANPFGTYFDATRVWAPIIGTTIYGGFRFTIKQKHEEEE